MRETMERIDREIAHLKDRLDELERQRQSYRLLAGPPYGMKEFAVQFVVKPTGGWRAVLLHTNNEALDPMTYGDGATCPEALFDLYGRLEIAPPENPGF